MGELTLKALKKRVEALEIALGMKTPNDSLKDCQNVAHMFGDSELMNAVDEDCHRDARVGMRAEDWQRRPIEVESSRGSANIAYLHDHAHEWFESARRIRSLEGSSRHTRGVSPL